MKRKSLFLCSTLCLSSCAVSPTLRAQNSGFVYVTNKPTSAQQPASILGYSIRDNTGELTAVPGSPFQMSLGADTLAVTSSGRFLYTPSAIPGVQDGWGVAGYAIDANSGSLTPVPGSPFYAGTSWFGPAWPIMDPSGKFLYVMTYYYSQVSYFITLYPNSTDCANFFPYSNIYAPDSVFCLHHRPDNWRSLTS